MSLLTNDVTVEVGGKKYTLEPTLNAVRTLGATLGGLRPAFRRVQDLDIDAMAAVIIAGAGLSLSSDEVDALTHAVWKADKAKLGGSLADYLVILLNGGEREKPKAKKPKETTEGNA